MVEQSLKFSNSIPTRRARILDTLIEIATFVESITNLHQLLSQIMEKSRAILSAEASSLLLYDEKTDELFFEIALGEKGEGLKEIRLKVGQGIAGRCAKERKPLHIPDVQKDPSWFKGADDKSGFVTKSILAVPMIHRQRLVGIIEVMNKLGYENFSEDDIAIMEVIASHAGIAIENARLIEENIKQERLAAVGQTVAGIAHDVKNILMGMQGGAELVDMGIEMNDGSFVEKGWKIVKRNEADISDLVLNMLNYSKERSPVLESVDINEIIRNGLEIVSQKAQDKKVKFIENLREIPEIKSDRTGISRVVLNLLSNAIDAMNKEDGLITVETKVGGADTVEVSVTDNGSGIAPEMLQKLFTPFQSTKGSKGTGLGLAVTKKIIYEIGGEIKVQSKLGEGTSFTVILPIQ